MLASSGFLQSGAYSGVETDVLGRGGHKAVFIVTGLTCYQPLHFAGF